MPKLLNRDYMYKMSIDFLKKLRTTDNPEKVVNSFFESEQGPDTDHLDYLCNMQGQVDEGTDPGYRTDEAIVKGSECLVICTVFFREKFFNGGCPDMFNTKDHAVQCECVINLETGDIEWHQDDN